MGVRREALISENPYRLLTLPSETSYPQLRKKADAALKGLQVGIAPPVALQSSFGDGDFEEFQSNVRLLAHDPVRRTCYRLLWPLVPTTLTAVLNGGVLKREQLPNFVISQALFLNAWYDFLETSDPEELRSALKQFSAFMADKRGEKLLTEFVSEEDRLLETDAKNQVQAAQLQVQKQVLLRSIAIAAELARKGGLDRCCSIVTAVLASSWDQTLQEASLGKVIEFGNVLSQKVTERTQEYSGTAGFPPLAAMDLESLISAVGNRHPATKSWMDTVEECYSTFVCGWIDRAVEIANQDKDYKSALVLLERCGQYKVGPELASRAARNLEIVRGNLAGQNAAEPQRATNQPGSVQGAIPRMSPVGPANTARIASTPWGCIVWVLLAGSAGVSGLLELSNRPESPLPASISNSVEPAGPAGDSETSPSSSSSLTPSAGTPTSASPSQAKSLPARPAFTLKRVQEGPAVPTEIDLRLQNLIKEHDVLSAEVEVERSAIRSEQDRLKEDKAAIDLDKSGLDALSSNLDSMKANIDSQRPLSTSDADQLAAFNRLVDDYNSQLETYKSNSASFNSRVNSYNTQLGAVRERLRQLNQKVDRINELASKINSGGR